MDATGSGTQGCAMSARKPLRCRFGIHSWQHHRNDEGQGYLTCYRCDKYRDHMSFVDSTGGIFPG